jgi:hypothetical protein
LITALSGECDLDLPDLTGDCALDCLNPLNWAGIGRAGSIAEKSLGTNPFKGKTAQEIAKMLEKRGYAPRGPNPAAGRGTYVNPSTGRGYHIDASHPSPKGPHVGVHRPRDIRDTMLPRDYPLEGP